MGNTGTWQKIGGGTGGWQPVWGGDGGVLASRSALQRRTAASIVLVLYSAFHCHITLYIIHCLWHYTARFIVAQIIPRSQVYCFAGVMALEVTLVRVKTNTRGEANVLSAPLLTTNVSAERSLLFEHRSTDDGRLDFTMRRQKSAARFLLFSVERCLLSVACYLHYLLRYTVLRSALLRCYCWVLDIPPRL